MATRADLGVPAQELAKWADDDSDGFPDFETEPASKPQQQQKQQQQPRLVAAGMANYQETEGDDTCMDDLDFGDEAEFALTSTAGSTVDVHGLMRNHHQQQQQQQAQQGGPTLLKLGDLSKCV